MGKDHKESALERHYWCFISYRHTDNREEGRQWANWLHQQLETYEVPKDLAGTKNERGEVIPSRIFPVFRDELELGTGSLSERITMALDQSRTLVVICSPRVLQSTFVSGEIRHFKITGKSNYVYAVVVDGEPGASLFEGGKCFPDELRYELDAAGQLQVDRPAEPLAADFRLDDGTQGWTTPEAYEQQLKRQGGLPSAEVARRVKTYAARLELGKLKLVSGILGVPLGTLQKRDKAYQLHLARRRARIFAGVLAGMSVLATLAVWRTIDSNRQRDTARANEAQGWMLRAEVAKREGEQHPSTLFYAARAIGFDGVGREEQTSKTVLDQVADWIPVFGQEDRVPRLWTRWRNPEQYEQARQWIRDNAGYLPVWSTETGKAAATSLAISPEGRYLALSAQDGSVRLWDFSAADPVQVSKSTGKQVLALAFHPRDKVLAVAEERQVRFWDLAAKSFTSSLAVTVTALAYSPSGQVLAGAAADGSIILWEGEHRTILPTGQSKPAKRLVFNADDSLMAAVFPGIGVAVYYHRYGVPHLSWAARGDEVTAWVEDAGEITAVAFCPKGVSLALGSAEGAVSLWESASARFLGEVVPQQRHGAAVVDLDFRPDGLQLASASEDGTVKLWKVANGQPDIEATLVGHLRDVGRVFYAPDGTLLASAGSDGTAKLWDVSGRKGEDPALYPYIQENWYGFDTETQKAGWKSGSGYLNLPRKSGVAIWKEKKTDELFAQFMQTGNWAGAALLADDSQRGVVAKALLADAGLAVETFQFNRARLRLAQVEGIDGAHFKELDSRIKNVTAAEGSHFTNGEKMDFIWCPAGSFVMGSPVKEPGRWWYEQQHKVTLTHGFWIGKYEVTQAQYQGVMGVNPSTNVTFGLNAPVENISWHEAVEFCRRLTDRERARGSIPKGWEYTLPTEAQWEYACRAGTATAYSFGDDTSILARFGNFNDLSGKFSDFDEVQDDGYKETAPVGSYQPNPWGIYDMHGNVFEWCLDSLDLLNAGHPLEDQTDPLVTRGSDRVLRGGCFRNPASSLRSAARIPSLPTDRNYNLGLRPVLVVTTAR